MPSVISKNALLAAIAALALGACSPVVSQRGYIPDPEKVAQVQIGVDDKTSVSERLGTPSNAATFDGDTWYYIASTEEQLMFFRPETVRRDILAVGFDKDGRVSRLEHYGLKDGQVIAYSDNETETKGRELTFLQQMFGNIGKGLGGGGGGGGDQ